MFLHATIHTPVGTFTGTTNPEPSTYTELVETRDYLQSKMSGLSYLTIFSGKTEITIPIAVLANSVVVFTIK